MTVAGCSPKDAPKAADTTAAPVEAAPVAPAPAATGANVVNIAASDYKYDAPSTIPAGLTAFHLTSTGKEPHHATLIRLDSGKTVDDMMAVLKTEKPGSRPHDKSAGWELRDRLLHSRCEKVFLI